MLHTIWIAEVDRWVYRYDSGMEFVDELNEKVYKWGFKMFGESVCLQMRFTSRTWFSWIVNESSLFFLWWLNKLPFHTHTHTLTHNTHTTHTHTTLTRNNTTHTQHTITHSQHTPSLTHNTIHTHTQWELGKLPCGRTAKKKAVEMLDCCCS